ncbi:FAD/NAD(P)-binding protein [Streptomyces halobius]|uniref:FAD/NAD(P)-binding protein n=1 Tax=Streptomyces halobius TaxID=2879846 RepID=A0ABY4MAL5_9ACTN|nr:FAD/NAD(P)-binding protein [Streptomyces halobius]UQA93311.1 FAD/NAD(P)-binding protein [Streptomyces halobius]
MTTQFTAAAPPTAPYDGQHAGRHTTLAIVGAGSRGLGLIERLVSHCLADPFPVTVHLVDPRPLGPGFHLDGQPDYLLLNTVCAQVTAFADEDMVDGPTRVDGPSLYEWCRARELRLSADGYTVREARADGATDGREIRPDDFLPRRLLSEYLLWAAQRVVAAAPPCFALVPHATTAREVRPSPSGGETVLLDDGGRIDADAVFVTVGHHSLYLPTEPPPEPRLVTRPYPLPAALDGIAPGDRVAVLGMGLTAMDVVASLTLGRGGRHETTGEGAARYVPSGDEPLIVLANRSGLPSRSRPCLPPGRVRFAPLALAPDRIRELRERRPDGRIAFAEDVLPLVEAEMELAYYRALLGSPSGDVRGVGADFARRAAESGCERLLAELRAEHGPFPLRGILTEQLTDRQWREQADYTEWFTAQVADDLAEARAGLGVSPVKEALEVLRDHRDALRSVIDAPGVDDPSLEHFFGTFTTAVNRLVIGPQLDRSAELLALLDAGVLRLGPGPRPKVIAPSGRGPWRLESTCLARPESVEADHVVLAHLAEPAADQLPGSLLGRLVAAGRVTTMRSHGTRAPGLYVTREGRGIGADGEVQPRLFFLGPHTEGSSYYNHYVPSPGAPSRALKDAELALRTALPALTARTS